jgi:hypothetical protein
MARDEEIERLRKEQVALQTESRLEKTRANSKDAPSTQQRRHTITYDESPKKK